jgi:hypothetical protein
MRSIARPSLCPRPGRSTCKKPSTAVDTIALTLAPILDVPQKTGALTEFEPTAVATRELFGALSLLPRHPKAPTLCVLVSFLRSVRHSTGQ